MSVLAMSRGLLLSAMRVACGALVACGAAAQPAAPALFKVVEIAGDGSLPVFDNAVAAFDAQLVADGAESSVARRLSATTSPGRRANVAPATVAQIVRAVASMKPGAGQGCLVFATSHGVRQAGLYLSLRNEVLTPQALDRALLQGCGNAPTAIVVSSCFSGVFARPPMARPNRVILTAARPDRTSFGCQAGRIYTVYDRCLLDALGQASGWRPASTSIQSCVAAEERRERVLPSEPQAWFGADAAAVPWPSRAG